MSSKRYQSPTPPSITLTDGITTLPTNRPIAVYYRQSTDAQIGNISTSIQTVDMVAYLTAKGWDKEHIYMIDMDAGVSGTTKIDERPGMKHLFDLITRGEIGAVACQDEDRLFRDVTQIQVNIFIEACRTSRVLVITPNMVYDFANDLTGSFHARQFRFKSEMAAEYINTVILGKLNRAKHRLLMEGRWAGFAVLPGFMIDVRKTLPDGSKNPDWRRYVPFPEYAEVVREYFRIFISYAGNVHATIKHIHTYGPFYPDPAECPPPEGYKVVFKMKKYARGYCPARKALEQMFTNALVIGHWSVNNTIVRWNNHPPIVDEEVFWQAFNYLSPITLDGQANPHYKPFSSQARPKLEETRPVERPLYAGMVLSLDGDEWRRVGTMWIKDREEYVYMFSEKHPLEGILWRRSAHFVDQAITELVHERLKSTFDTKVWNETLAMANQEYDEDIKQKRAHIGTLERVMHNHILSLESLTNIDMIHTVQDRYEEAQREHKRLSAELAVTIGLSERIEALKRLRDRYYSAVESWDVMTRDEQRTILHMFIRHIEATESDGSGLRLVVQWFDGSTNEKTLPKQMKNGWRTWLDSETEKLLFLVDAGASQVEIAAQFPSRTWKQLMDKIAAHLGAGTVQFAIHPMRETETYGDFVQRAEDLPTHYQAGSADRWTTEDMELLQQLIDENAPKLKYLEMFPHRNWLSITKKFHLLAADSPFPVDKRIRRQDTLIDFMQRFPDVEVHPRQLHVAHLPVEQSEYTQQNDITSSSPSWMAALTPACWPCQSSSRWTRPARWPPPRQGRSASWTASRCWSRGNCRSQKPMARWALAPTTGEPLSAFTGAAGSSAIVAKSPSVWITCRTTTATSLRPRCAWALAVLTTTPPAR